MPQSDSIETIIDSIRELQILERSLYDEQERLGVRVPPITDTEKFNLEKNIASVVAARSAAWNAILDRSAIINTGIGDAQNSLIAQVALLEITEDELDNARKQLDIKNGNNDTMNRKLQINTHYGSKFEAKTDLLKLSVKVFVPLIILLLLKNFGYISESISNILIALNISIGGIILIIAMWDINTRSEMNFDEYDWKYEDPSSQIPSIWQYNKENLNLANPLNNLAENLGICIGERCCDNGMYYNSSKQKCIKGVRLQSESFISGSLTGSELIVNNCNDKTIKGVTNSSMLGNASIL